MYNIKIIQDDDISVNDFKTKLANDEEMLKLELEKYRKKNDFIDISLDEKTVEDISKEQYLKKMLQDEEQEKKARLQREMNNKRLKAYHDYFIDVKKLNKVS